jgi:hypothetical protein
MTPSAPITQSPEVKVPSDLWPAASEVSGNRPQGRLVAGLCPDLVNGDRNNSSCSLIERDCHGQISHQDYVKDGASAHWHRKYRCSKGQNIEECSPKEDTDKERSVKGSVCFEADST